tara:strand:+ start:343 stop:1200 length:858 start_codon:yes stop_codon:yes gene_type:complete
MKNKNFAVFILSHGRPDNVITYKTLKKLRYKGKIYIIIDNEDKTQKKYYKNFGNKVIIFDKKAIAKTFDAADNFEDRRTIVYARNACFNIAKNLGITYFIQLDDDYDRFDYSFKKNLEYNTAHKPILSINKVFNTLIDFYKNTNIKSIAMGQGGDFIGGKNSGLWKKKLKRKAMNSFICSVNRPFKFIGRINEDVNTYTRSASVGDLFFTTALLRLNQKETQSSKGGMTDVYLSSGTYIKSFYTIMLMPSSVSINTMGIAHRRLHHRIKWNNTVPKIINEKYKKL